MKILHVLPSLSPGGMERLAIQLAGDAAAPRRSRGNRLGTRSLGGQGHGSWRRTLRIACHLT